MSYFPPGVAKPRRAPEPVVEPQRPEPVRVVPTRQFPVDELFPLAAAPYPAQVEALQRCFDAFESGKRFVILEGPPGIGKSAIAIALAQYYGHTFLCTATKQLQEQYLEDFARFGVYPLKGRDNFHCPRCGRSCKVGGDLFKTQPCGLEERTYEGERVAPCEYKVEKAKALAAPITTCNYKSYIWNIWASFGGVPRRPLTVVDECHKVESELLESVTVSIHESDVPRWWTDSLPDAMATSKCFEWLQRFVDGVSPRLAVLDSWDDSQGPVQDHEKVGDLRDVVRRAQFALRSREAEEWISEPPEGTKKGERKGFVLKPLTVRSFSDRLLGHGERVLLMSATILDADLLASSLGIPAKEMAFVQMPCTFPEESRLIYQCGLDVSSRVLNDPDRSERDCLLELTDRAMDRHPYSKGLILVPSDKRMQMFVEGLSPKNAKRLIAASGANREVQLRKHCEAEGPTVLIASGYWEGLNLPDDMSRFCIIPIIPRAPWSGQIEARAERADLGGRRWYRSLHFCKLIQGTGRSVRHPGDFAATYCFDSELQREADRDDEPSLLPKWLRGAIRDGWSLLDPEGDCIPPDECSL